MLKKLTMTVALSVLSSQAQAPVVDKETDLSVRLLAPLTTKFSRKGDLVSAKVLTPQRFQGGILEGEVRDVRAGVSNRGATIRLQFQLLHLTGTVLPIAATVINVTNSQGQPNLDDEGLLVQCNGEKESHPGKLASMLHSSATGSIIRLTTSGSNFGLGVGAGMTVRIESKLQ